MHLVLLTVKIRDQEWKPVHAKPKKNMEKEGVLKQRIGLGILEE